MGNFHFQPSRSTAATRIIKKIIKWHKCTEEQKKHWQFKFHSGVWLKTYDIEPDWIAKKYRLNPEFKTKKKTTMTVTLESGKKVELPKPLSKKPNVGDTYWAITNDLVVYEVVFKADKLDDKRLSLGLCYKDEQTAIAARDALITIRKGE